MTSAHNHLDVKQQLQNVLAHQRAAFRAEPMPSVERRIAYLKALDKALRQHQDALAAAVSDDFGSRSADEFKMAELLYLLMGLAYCIKHVKQWMKPSKRHVAMLQQPGKAAVHYQPLGVVGIMVPWNYPVYLSVGPLMYALAAGNRAMIKMSSHTPRLNAVFTDMLADIFPQDLVSVHSGSGDVTDAFATLPFDHLTFTGSTRVGKIVMEAAAKNLTPVLLELGGKSPVVVHDSFPLEQLVERLGFGKCWNAGQTCIAPDHLYLPRGKRDDFIRLFTAQVSTMYPTLRDNPDYTSIINSRQLARLQRYLDDAVSKGAQIVMINPANEDLTNSGKLPVTLVLGASREMLIMQEEVFGPLLPVLEYDDLQKVLDTINDGPRPLALYYLDYNEQRQQHVIETTHAGGVTINDVMQHAGVDDLPFGGIGASGMGRYHGPEGFITLSHAKSVLVKGRFSGLRFILPPFNKASHRAIKKHLLAPK
ncbi:MAG: coniferyl aldehyde dehydrogenase [Moraxellaceae bacterium]|nr:coniferyl aldehyde dehydrogenase [Moraxellaceae bacterium]MDZ4296884.1 coniferyl aldehyde dehydrogenase [Moraxellaceae bacterium]MDZ4386561.1 coniferyl aldehyde dehydrogenase [Moraxellaceae bacterium]